MIEQAYLIHALSPLHAGTGSAADIIDLPIARQTATGIPILPGSSTKGVLRDARKPSNGSGNEAHWLATFGPENGDEHAGAIVLGDARLLALPVRSFKGAFAWVTSPLLLRLAKRDHAAWRNLPVPTPNESRALVTENSICMHEGHVYLQDIDLAASLNDYVDKWSEALMPAVSPDSDDIFTPRFIVVDDETMTFLWETATQVDTRIRIDPGTGVVAKGALWHEESLPPETLLIGLMAADRARRPGLNGWGKPEDVMHVALAEEDILQFGGKASVGRGRCRIVPLPTDTHSNDTDEGGEHADPNT